MPTHRMRAGRIHGRPWGRKRRRRRLAPPPLAERAGTVRSATDVPAIAASLPPARTWTKPLLLACRRYGVLDRLLHRVRRFLGGRLAGGDRRRRREERVRVV